MTVARTLKLAVDNGLSTSTDFSITTNLTSSQTFDLAGYNQTLGSLTSACSVTTTIITNSVSATVSTLTVAGSGKTTTYAGLLTGNLNLTLNGSSSTLATLSGANTYSGSTTISGGTLALSGGGSIASTTLAVTNNATFDVSAITPTGYTLPGTLALNLNKTGSTLTQGQVVLGTKNLTYAGSLTVTATGDALASGDSFLLFTNTGTKSGWFSSVSSADVGQPVSRGTRTSWRRAGCWTSTTSPPRRWR